MAVRTLQELVAAAASLHSDRAAVKYDGSMLLYRDLVRLSGKVDMEALMKTFQTQRRSFESSRLDFTKLKGTLRSLWQETLALPEDAAVDEASNFLLSGGDSLKALRLHEDILAAVGATSPELLEAILDGTF
ncbi:hypothetical protein VZT92_008060 [Zoarces viviparus]|uniref:Carrier domain-containing protein n=1 Tax=Zoarces viviparus TaxID=48416 RepID=A0AAW1FM83_ZOAVI